VDNRELVYRDGPVREVKVAAYRDGPAVPAKLSDMQIASIMVDASRAAYLASGHNCP
jgi:hypothetical protein